MLRLGIISNPFAKMNKNNPEHNTQMWYKLANEGLYKVTHSLNELEEVCREFAARKINLIGIVGGDGSMGLVLSCIAKSYINEQSLPKILLLKGGTINFLASNLGIYTSALTCLNDTLFFIKNKTPLFETAIRTIQVNDRLGFIFAGGIATAFLEDYYKHKTNLFGAALCLSKYFVDGLFAGKINGCYKKLVKPQRLHIETSPNPLWSKKIAPHNKKSNQLNSTEYTLVFASTVPSLPLNINLFKKINLNSQTAQLIAITEKGSTLVKGSLQALVGQDINKYPGVDSVLFENASIQSDNMLTYSLDGDLCQSENGRVDIKYGPSFIFCSPYYIADNA